MADRPYTLLSCCVSLDGFLAGPTNRRLLLSNAADLDRVDAVRAGCDAIRVGAATVRCDNPRLLVRDESRRRARQAAGRTPSPVKVTLSRGGRLDPDADFFTAGEGVKLVYSPDTGTSLSDRATMVSPPVTRSTCGGWSPTCTDAACIGSWWRVARPCTPSSWPPTWPTSCSWRWPRSSSVTPGRDDSSARASSPFHPGRRATLAQVSQIGDVALLRYALSDRYVG